MNGPALGNAIEQTRNANPKLFENSDLMLPKMNDSLAILYNPAVTFETANAAQIGNALANGLVQIEFFSFLNQADTKINTQTARAIALDVFTTAINEIRAEQANLRNQKTNLFEAVDALRATINVTQKAADSYLKTDYVLSAQQYSELIRTIVASITALQAANKIPEAAQRLINSLAR